MTTHTDPPAGDTSFERAMARLEEIVRQLEAGSLGLADSLVVFREGMELVARLSAELQAAEKVVQELTETGVRPFEERAEPDER